MYPFFVPLGKKVKEGILSRGLRFEGCPNSLAVIVCLGGEMPPNMCRPMDVDVVIGHTAVHAVARKTMGTCVRKRVHCRTNDDAHEQEKPVLLFGRRYSLVCLTVVAMNVARFFVVCWLGLRGSESLHRLLLRKVTSSPLCSCDARLTSQAVVYSRPVTRGYGFSLPLIGPCCVMWCIYLVCCLQRFLHRTARFLGFSVSRFLASW